MYDAVVAGAGPAGAYLAYLLARDGFKVAVIDKQRFPRDKVCGGGLSCKAVELLDFDLTPIIHRQISAAVITWLNRDGISCEIPGSGGCMVVRREFDDFLLRRAIATGAEFHPETAFVAATQDSDGVRIETDRGVLEAAFLFGADGVSSRVRSSVFGNGLVGYAAALEVLIHAGPEQLEQLGDRALFELGGVDRGYGWIFPKQDHFNVGVYSPLGAAGLRSSLDAFMRRYRILERAFRGRQQGYAIPFGNTHRLFEQGRVWLVGDAAGLAESIFGEGIYFALRSATLAVEALHRADCRPGTGVYNRLIRRRLLGDINYSRLLARFVYRNPEFAFQRLARNRFVNHSLTGIVTGELGYRRCFYRTLLGAPYWLWSRRFPADMQPL